MELYFYSVAAVAVLIPAVIMIGHGGGYWIYGVLLSVLFLMFAVAMFVIAMLGPPAWAALVVVLIAWGLAGLVRFLSG